MLTFIYVYNTLLELGKYYCFLGKLVLHYSNTFQCLEKIMHSLEIKSVGYLNYFTKELRWFCKPRRNSSFCCHLGRKGKKVIYLLFITVAITFFISFFFSTMCQIDYFVS